MPPPRLLVAMVSLDAKLAVFDTVNGTTWPRVVPLSPTATSPGSESRSVGLGLSRRPPSAGQAPLAALRGSLGLAYVQLLCVTDVGLVCVVERYDLTELKEYY